MDKEQFEIKKEHLLLLQKMYVGWNDCEFGAPEIDGKRPYGNSDVEQDMLEIIGLKELKEGIYEIKLFGKKWMLKGEDKYNIDLEGEDEQKLCEELNKLHEETKTVLQICLSTQSFKEGLYEADECSSKWEEKVNNG